jgi:2-succinyl-6-hydroxy-2,4-cyclohexadiene-1-carboxylate synthase
MRSLLLLHGFTGAPSSFDAALEALPEPARVLAPWLTGHGVPPAALEIETFEGEVDRLAAWIPEGERAVVVGYSLGARLALALAIRHSDRVQALVAISGSAGLPTATERGARRARDAALAQRLERDGLAAFVRFWEDQPLFATQTRLPPALIDAERARRLGHTAEGLAHALARTGLAEMPDYFPTLPRLHAPVEVLAGELDPKFSALGRALAGALPKGRFTPLSGAGHNLLLERPTAVAAAILRGFSA